MNVYYKGEVNVSNAALFLKMRVYINDILEAESVVQIEGITSSTIEEISLKDIRLWDNPRINNNTYGKGKTGCISGPKT